MANANGDERNLEGFKWRQNAILMLISLIGENYDELQTGVKKLVYRLIAKEMNDKIDTNLTSAQVDKKWKGLKRTYYKIKNSKKGQPTKCWFYNEIDEILYSETERNSPVTLSTDDTSFCDTADVFDDADVADGVDWSETENKFEIAAKDNEYNPEGFKWSTNLTWLLISLIKKYYNQLHTGVKKTALQQMAKEINNKTGTNLTYEQVDSKWKGLKRTYNKIKDSNSDTGQPRKCWVFYSEVEEILHSDPLNMEAPVSEIDSVEKYEMAANGNESNFEGFKWSKNATLLLISLIRENYIQLQRGAKKPAFQKIAKEINGKIGTKLTFEQVDSKWKGLKRTYNKIKDSNTEQPIKFWDFYNQVDEILHSDVEIDPLVTEDIRFISDNDTKDVDYEVATSSQNRKRHHSGDEDIEAAKERRHQERMAVAKKFLTIFEKMVDKM